MDKVRRPEFLRTLAGAPLVVAGVLTATAAEAADNKKQFKYQDKPGPGGNKCSGCRFFKKPSSCSIVTGKISPNGYCIAYAKK